MMGSVAKNASDCSRAKTVPIRIRLLPSCFYRRVWPCPLAPYDEMGVGEERNFCPVGVEKWSPQRLAAEHSRFVPLRPL